MNASKMGENIPSSSELIGVGNMPVQSSTNLAGRKPGSKNNSTATGTVTYDSNFASLTNVELIQVLKWNSRPYSGKNKDGLLAAVRINSFDQITSKTIIIIIIINFKKFN